VPLPSDLAVTLRQHGDDREAYSAAKTAFIRALVNAQV
jgi:hypothetical protein